MIPILIVSAIVAEGYGLYWLVRQLQKRRKTITDIEMLMLTHYHENHFGCMVNYDDESREYYYPNQEALDESQKNGWTVISMKNDFKEIFSNYTEKIEYECSSDFWKNNLELWEKVGLDYNDDFDETFGKNYFGPDITLEQAISMEGVGMNHLARSGTAAYLDALVMPQQNPRFGLNEDFKKISPLTQQKLGIPSEETICKENFTLMTRPPLNSAVCVEDDHASKLEDRGWMIINNPSSTLPLKLKPVIPSDDQRAQKIVVHFQGTDIAPPQTMTTFSKFSPIEKDNLPFLIPDNTFEEKTAMFYLESLPSSDKEWFYQLLERYVNAGKIPEEFDVTVEVFSGDETLL